MKAIDIMPQKTRVSPSLEDYLETILFLSQKKDAVRVTDIASDMNISKPSVNKAMNLLKSKGLVEHEHYGTISLTSRGLEIAQNIAGRHTIIKRFLMGLLGVEEEVAEEEACLIEHSMSKDTVDKLNNYVNSVLK
ncbi:MAG: metal-dependent transcriptional regulator [Clostridiales bacterium]|jgi:DtxR family Mn-dependent transcriptional regulator|nr:metal-dependent transcriptional regulator [Clostridiales bacterium]